MARWGFGEGEPVDWLVVMRRFDADDLLEVVASRGGLDALLVRQFADEIARFHDRAEVVRCEHGAQRVRRVIDGNRASMASVKPASLSVSDCADLHATS